MGLDLKLDHLIGSLDNKVAEPTWVQLATMNHTTLLVDKACGAVKVIMTKDAEIRNAVDTLKTLRTAINTHGASESLLCVFNENNQLESTLRMHIPSISTENADQVGTAVTANIDTVVEDADSKVRKFFTDITSAVSTYMQKIKEQADAQTSVLSNLLEKELNGCDDNTVDSTQVSSGYSYPLFMDKLSALQYIADNLVKVECTKEAIEEFAPKLKVLGYTPTIKSFENINDPELAVVPDEPAPEAEPPLTPKPEGDPDEVISTEEPGMPASAWTGATIRTAVIATKQLIATTDKVTPIADKVNTLCSIALSASDAIKNNSGVDRAEQETSISKCRNLVAFIVDIAILYNTTTRTLIDQAVKLASLVAPKVDPVVPNTPVTPAEPAPQPESSPLPPAETEPTKVEEPAPGAVKPWYAEAEEPEQEPDKEPPAKQEPTPEQPVNTEPAEPTEPIGEPNTQAEPEQEPEKVSDILGVKLF